MRRGQKPIKNIRDKSDGDLRGCQCQQRYGLNSLFCQTHSSFILKFKLGNFHQNHLFSAACWKIYTDISPWLMLANMESKKEEDSEGHSRRFITGWYIVWHLDFVFKLVYNASCLFFFSSSYFHTFSQIC